MDLGIYRSESQLYGGIDGEALETGRTSTPEPRLLIHAARGIANSSRPGNFHSIYIDCAIIYNYVHGGCFLNTDIEGNKSSNKAKPQTARRTSRQEIYSNYIHGAN